MFYENYYCITLLPGFEKTRWWMIETKNDITRRIFEFSYTLTIVIDALFHHHFCDRSHWKCLLKRSQVLEMKSGIFWKSYIILSLARIGDIIGMFLLLKNLLMYYVISILTIFSLVIAKHLSLALVIIDMVFLLLIDLSKNKVIDFFVHSGVL